jgi:hypothetical protein
LDGAVFARRRLEIRGYLAQRRSRDLLPRALRQQGSSQQRKKGESKTPFAHVTLLSQDFHYGFLATVNYTQDFHFGSWIGLSDRAP